MKTENEVNIDHKGFLRVSQILQILPVSRTQWFNWVRDGIAPKPVKLGNKIIAFRTVEINEFIKHIDENGLD